MSSEELDRAIATEVMGWQDHPSFAFALDVPGSDEPAYRYKESWSPSTDISHAWEVVEKMRERRWQFNRHPESDQWQAIVNCRALRDTKSACVETLPRAICLAALAAVRAENNQQQET